MTRVLPASWYKNAVAALEVGDKGTVRRLFRWADEKAGANLDFDADFLQLLQTARTEGLWADLGSRAAVGVSTEPIADPAEVALASKWLREAQQMTMLIGAGASVGPPANIPATRTLLTEAWAHMFESKNRDLERLHEWCMEAEIDNIEDLLSAVAAADIATVHPKSGYLLLRMLLSLTGAESLAPNVGVSPREWEKLAHNLNTYGYERGVAQLMSMLCARMAPAPANDAHRSVVRLCSALPVHAVITTNYDVCLEKACALENRSWRYAWDAENNLSAADIQIMKLHGSINVFSCERCFSIYSIALQQLIDVQPLTKYCEMPRCGGEARHLIVPPVRQKGILHPALIPAWNTAAQSLRLSDVVLVIGYSFGDADGYIERLFALEVLRMPGKRVVIVNPSRSAEEHLRALRSMYANEEDRRNLLTVVGKAEQVLPLIETGVRSSLTRVPDS